MPYKNHRILALIPARGGSKGIKGKNLAPLLGKPLIAYTIEAALQCGCFDDIVVSTDSEEIAGVARDWGASVPFSRPDFLADDLTGAAPVIVHALEELQGQDQTYDIVILLQPTSPLRTPADISESLDLFIDDGLRSLASVSQSVEHPLFLRTMSPDGKLFGMLEKRSDALRQQLTDYYYVNGAIYINWVRDVSLSWVGNDNENGYVMPVTNSLEIDYPQDLETARAWLMYLGRNENS